MRIEKARGRQFPDAMSLEDSMKAPSRSVPIKPVPLSLLLGGLHRSVCCVFVHYAQQGTGYMQQGVSRVKSPFPLHHGHQVPSICLWFSREWQEVSGTPRNGRKYIGTPGSDRKRGHIISSHHSQCFQVPSSWKARSKEPATEHMTSGPEARSWKTEKCKLWVDTPLPWHRMAQILL